MEKTFVNSNKTSKFAKVFSLESVPLYGTTHAEEFLWTIKLTNWPSGTMSIKLHVHVSRQANISQGTPRTVSVTWAKRYNGAFCHTSVIWMFQLSKHPPVPTCSDKWLPTVLSSCHSYSYTPVQLSRALFPPTFLRRMHPNKNVVEYMCTYMCVHFWGGCGLWWVQVSHPDKSLLSGYGHNLQTFEVYKIEPVHQTFRYTSAKNQDGILRSVEYSGKSPLDSDWCRK